MMMRMTGCYLKLTISDYTDPPVSGQIDPPCAGIISEHTDPPANVKIGGFRSIVTHPFGWISDHTDPPLQD